MVESRTISSLERLKVPAIGRGGQCTAESTLVRPEGFLVLRIDPGTRCRWILRSRIHRGSLPFRTVNSIPEQPEKIVLYPDPVLARPAEPVEVFDEGLQALVERMIELMRDAQGAGLAAPQVGVSRRLFIVEDDSEAEGPPIPSVFINPELELGGDLVPFEEGCLSIPDVRITVRRPEAVRIKAFDLQGQAFELEDAGFLARVWQHEFDHLEGVLITDRMNPRDRLANRKTLKEMRLDFEEDSER